MRCTALQQLEPQKLNSSLDGALYVHLARLLVLVVHALTDVACRLL